MDNFQNNPGGGNFAGRPQLKKVRRPINRLMPQGPVANSSAGNSASAQTAGNPFQNPQNNRPSQPSAPVSDHLDSRQQSASSAEQRPLQNNPFARPQPSESDVNATQMAQPGDDAFNLDAYLDSGNLPVNKVAPAKFDDHQQPDFLDDDEDDEDDNVFGSRAGNEELPPYLTKKVLILLGAMLFFLGLITSKLMFNEQKIVRNGLQGVVINPEVPRGRARCGVAEKTQGCVLYIMNPQRQELNARDFYDLASQLTGRQRFVIETGNMRYSNTKIRPGDIVQLNIPPL